MRLSKEKWVTNFRAGTKGKIKIVVYIRSTQPISRLVELDAPLRLYTSHL
jgi:hypothetical protein